MRCPVAVGVHRSQPSSSAENDSGDVRPRRMLTSSEPAACKHSVRLSDFFCQPPTKGDLLPRPHTARHRVSRGARAPLRPSGFLFSSRPPPGTRARRERAARDAHGARAAWRSSGSPVYPWSNESARRPARSGTPLATGAYPAGPGAGRGHRQFHGDPPRHRLRRGAAPSEVRPGPRSRAGRAPRPPSRRRVTHWRHPIPSREVPP